MQPDRDARLPAGAGEQPTKASKKRKGALKVPKKASKLIDKWAAAKKDLVIASSPLAIGGVHLAQMFLQV